MTPQEKSEHRLLSRLIDHFIGIVHDRGKVEPLVHLGRAVRAVMDKFPDIDLSFHEFKAALRPNQAEGVALKVYEISELIGNRHPEGEFDRMAFYLVANSLYAKAGAKWIEPAQEELIDEWIHMSVEIFERKGRHVKEMPIRRAN